MAAQQAKNLEAQVAPHAGAWIEIVSPTDFRSRFKVAPHAGAWIEMSIIPRLRASTYVAPHAGAWIEIFLRGITKD